MDHEESHNARAADDAVRAGLEARGPSGARACRPAVGHKGWHSRGYLPHFDSPEAIQFVTFRLADSLPQPVVADIARNPDARRRRLTFEETLDAGRGACALAEPETAEIVARTLQHFNGARYRLFAWVVMPNHVHVLFEPLGRPVGEIVRGWKSFTARAINQRGGEVGRFWAADYFDRFVRDENHFERARHYIEMNPVKAGLVSRPEAWTHSSAGRAGALPERPPPERGRPRPPSSQDGEFQT